MASESGGVPRDRVLLTDVSRIADSPEVATWEEFVQALDRVCTGSITEDRARTLATLVACYDAFETDGSVDHDHDQGQGSGSAGHEAATDGGVVASDGGDGAAGSATNASPDRNPATHPHRLAAYYAPAAADGVQGIDPSARTYHLDTECTAVDSPVKIGPIDIHLRELSPCEVCFDHSLAPGDSSTSEGCR